ncbi:hypothetical protein FOL47_001542, partial [Perkinsus chesapeaki]
MRIDHVQQFYRIPMTVFADMMTLSRLSGYILHCCLVWSFGGFRAGKAFGQLPYPPNDPEFSRQRDLFETLHIQETWEAIRKSGLPRRDVIVTVIDTGVATKQPDLVGQLLKGQDASGSLVPSVEDMEGHGTEVTSVIAAGINNGTGIAGVADRIKVRPIRATASPSGAATDEESERAWVEANKFDDSDVIVYATAGPFEKERSVMYKNVITEAVKKGNFVVVAASNSDQATGPEEVLLPCSMANSMRGVVCVAATLTASPTVLMSEASLLASFGVPGTQVIVATKRDKSRKWKYVEVEGSSSATAIVGGIAALMRSFKKFTPDVMKEILLNVTVCKVKTKKGVEMLYGVLRPDLAVKRAIELARH